MHVSQLSVSAAGLRTAAPLPRHKSNTNSLRAETALHVTHREDVNHCEQHEP